MHNVFTASTCSELLNTDYVGYMLELLMEALPEFWWLGLEFLNGGMYTLIVYSWALQQPIRDLTLAPPVRIIGWRWADIGELILQ